MKSRWLVILDNGDGDIGNVGIVEADTMAKAKESLAGDTGQCIALHNLRAFEIDMMTRDWYYFGK